MQSQMRALSAGALLLSLPTLAAAQGGDDCSIPTPITTAGAYPYDSSLATDSGFDGNGVAPCSPNGNPFESDLFWVFTPTVTGAFTVTTCGGATYDTQLSVHLGANCAATCLDYNDQACGNQSSINFAGTAATDYLIQVGGWSGVGSGTNGPGILTIVVPGPPPTNDVCSTPDVISGLGSFAYDRTSSTSSGFDGSDPITCAGAEGGLPPYRDVFFAWTALASGTHIFDNCGSGNDTQMNVHLGADCTAVCVAAADGSPNCFGGESEVTVPGITSGQTYLIQIGDWDDSTTTVALGSLNVSVPPPPPTNDTCATPDVISGVGSFPFDRTAAVGSGFDGGNAILCASANGNVPPDRDVFFAWTALASGIFIFDNCGEGADTDMNIHVGGDCTATCLANNDEGGCATLGESEIALTGVIAGDVYLVQVGNWAPGSLAGGPGALNVSVPAVARPGNDTCATPTAISGVGSFGFDTTTALTSNFVGGDPTICGPAINGTAPHRDVFFAWTAAASGDIRFDTCGSPFDTSMNVHVGGDCSATCIEGNDNGLCAINGESQVTVYGILAGSVYLVQIGEWDNNPPAPGVGTLNVTVPPPPPANDTCATPTAIGGLGSFAYDTTSASTSNFTGAAAGCVTGIVEDDVFFVWTAAAAGDFRFDTCGVTYDTRIAVYSGTDCLATCVAENDNFCGLQSRVSVPGLSAGDTMLIQVGAFTADVEGPGVLNVTIAPPPPANNDCSTPLAIGAEGAYAFNNESATTSGFDGGDPGNCMSPLNIQNSGLGQATQDVFWAFTVPCNGDYLFDTMSSPVITDTRLSVHFGADCSATCVASNDDFGGSLLSELTIPGLLAGDTYLIQVGNWNDDTNNSPFGDGVLSIANISGSCPSSSITVACDPASPHYLGNYAKMDSSSFGSGIGSDLHLEVTDGPAGEFGFILVSLNSSANLAIFNGVLCLGSPQGRYNPTIATNQGNPALNSIGQFDGAGVLQSLFGNATSSGGSGYDVPSALPYSPAGQMIQSGDMWSFQCWYRDQIAPLPNPGSSANFSNAIDVVFP